MTTQQKPDYDAIVIGAGFAGLSLIHYLRDAGLSMKVFDRASDIGGTWTWNRYPGAMTDSESYYYCLTFSKELLQEWSWTKRYPDWSETHSYMHFVADKCDMWPHIQLDTEIVSADYQTDSGLWLVKTGAGEQYTCKYFISGMGMISEPVIPKTPGMDRFTGPLFHSSRWPEGLDYAGKRVGIIGHRCDAPKHEQRSINITAGAKRDPAPVGSQVCPHAMSRYDRLFRLTNLLAGKRSWRVVDLAKKMEVTRRTIYRDLDELSSCGIPVFQDERGYRLLDNKGAPPLRLDAAERAALLLAVDNQPHRNRLNPARREPPGNLGPQQGGYHVTDHSIQESSRLLRIHAIHINLLRLLEGG